MLREEWYCEIGFSCARRLVSGERVSNTQIIYLQLGDSPSKDGLIPDGPARVKAQAG